MRYLTVRYLLVTMRILTVRPRDPLVGGGVKFFYQETSLGHHEISHGEISPGHQENLLVNKFPVLTPPLNFERYCNQVGMSASTIPPSHP